MCGPLRKKPVSHLSELLSIWNQKINDLCLNNLKNRASLILNHHDLIRVQTRHGHLDPAAGRGKFDRFVSLEKPDRFHRLFGLNSYPP